MKTLISAPVRFSANVSMAHTRANSSSLKELQLLGKDALKVL